MTKIYLIRHAEAEGNLYRRIQGHWDGSITPLGLQQVDALAQRFRREHIDALYCSDLSRARATAEAITRYHDIPAVATPRLTEICMGVWEGRAWGDVEHEFPEQMRYFNTDPDRWSVPGCEPICDVQKRMKRAISDLAARHDGQTIALVSHGMAIRAYLCTVLGIPNSEMATLPYGDNTSVSLLLVDGDHTTVEYYNDNRHLPDALSTPAAAGAAGGTCCRNTAAAAGPSSCWATRSGFMKITTARPCACTCRKTTPGPSRSTSAAASCRSGATPVCARTCCSWAGSSTGR